MKRKIIILAALLLVVSFCLSGCGAQQSSGNITGEQIASAIEEISTNGDRIIVKMADGRTFDLGTVLSGKDGKDGVDGKDGTAGLDGKDGVNGKDGKNGIDGKDGKDGINGADGKDGLNGKDGKDGANGIDGKDGVDGKDGISVQSVEINVDGHLICTMSDGSEIDAGEIPALGDESSVVEDGYSIPVGNNLPFVINEYWTITSIEAVTYGIEPIVTNAYGFEGGAISRYRVDFSITVEQINDPSSNILDSIDLWLLNYKNTYSLINGRGLHGGNILVNGEKPVENYYFEIPEMMTNGENVIKFSAYVPLVDENSKVFVATWNSWVSDGDFSYIPIE